MTHLSTPQPARHVAPTAKARELAYLVFERPDLQRAEAFLTSFGLRAMHQSVGARYYRGAAPTPYCYRVHHASDSEPRFVGFGLRVDTRAELEALARLPGATSITPARHPGGGELVYLTDPAGFMVEAVFGQEEAAALPERTPLSLQSFATPVRVNATQRLDPTAPLLRRLGHVVLEVVDFQRVCAWYTMHFGFIPSDVQVLPDGSPAVVFLRLDLGEAPADHHTLALAQGIVDTYSHSAYELVDTDALGMGQRVLREAGYRHAWGLGRHILGSQIFDYWCDPWGDKHEHYCDGDLFTSEPEMGVHAASRDAMAQWGPPMPRSFTQPKLTPKAVLAVARNVQRSPDLTLRKMLTLARLFG